MPLMLFSFEVDIDPPDTQSLATVAADLTEHLAKFPGAVKVLQPVKVEPVPEG